MFNKAAEKTASLLILIGAPFTTIFVTTQTVTDPVNVTKLASLGGLGLGLLALTSAFNLKFVFLQNRLFMIFALGFFLSAVNAVLNSKSPMTQNLYGSYGRNTGLITYLLLLAVCISMLTFRELSSFERIIQGLQIAGVINVIYCAWVILFGDFLSWSNPYQNILGLFGNPNFISAYLGIFITSILAIMVSSKTSNRWRLVGVVISAIAFYEILDSNAIQGIVVTAGGVAIIGFFLVRAHLKKTIFTFIYVILTIVAGLLAIAGALQKGPFTFIYKTSVSLRGAYWDAGVQMGNTHLLTGVGMDSYGDWYRRLRSEQAATVLPGPRTITNSAHNVVIDLFSYGGLPLLLTYLALLTIAGAAAVKVM